jgi:septum formation protein
VAFEVRVPEVQEVVSGPPYEVAAENAYRKAHAIREQVPHGSVLGADTVVSLGRTVYGKPADRGQARATLEALAGRRHAVIGGLCLIASDARPRTATATTAVTFRALDEGLLEWYLETGEWRDRAGAYAIQGRGAALVKSIEGDYLNVVGLPIGLLLELEPGLLR